MNENENDDALDIHSTLKLDVTNLLVHAEELREQAGRSEKGRLLAIACTEIQKVKAFIGYEGL
jgi:hypothetical protein